MGADDDPVGLAARLADPAQIVLQVAFIGFGGDTKAFGQDIAIAEQVQLGGAGAGEFLVAVKMFARALGALFKTELAADALQLREGRGVDGVGGLETERIDAGTAAQIGALFAGLVPWP